MIRKYIARLNDQPLSWALIAVAATFFLSFGWLLIASITF
jgi:hypothetical protein